jgi:hypothetical protein
LASFFDISIFSCKTEEQAIKMYISISSGLQNFSALKSFTVHGRMKLLHIKGSGIASSMQKMNSASKCCTVSLTAFKFGTDMVTDVTLVKSQVIA